LTRPIARRIFLPSCQGRGRVVGRCGGRRWRCPYQCVHYPIAVPSTCSAVRRS